MGKIIGYIGHTFIVWALLSHVAFAQGEDNTILQDNRHYTYIYWENGYPTREARSRRPQSWANTYARENPDLVIQTGYYSLVLNSKTMQLDGYDALTGSDYVTALHQDVTKFTPASLMLKAYQDGIEYTATSGLVQNGSDAKVRLIESGQFLQRYDHLGIEFTAADGSKLDVEGRLEISAWPEHVVFKLDFSNFEGTAVNVDRTVIQLTSPAGKSFTSDASSISTTLGVRPHEDLENAPLNPTSIITTATDLQKNNALDVEFDTDLHALKVNLPINGVRYPAHIDRVDEFLIEVSNPTANSLDIPLVFEENTPRAITGTVMLLTDADDGKPTGIPIQISKNWHVGSDTGVKAIHRGSWLRGSTYFTLPAGTTKRFKLKVVFGYWASVGAASHSQLSLVGWGGNWKWDESAVGAWGESMTYDPTQHLGSSFMGDIRPTFTPSMSNGGEHNWTENVGGGDFLTYFDTNNQYRWAKRLKTAYVWTGPNMTQVMYSGITDDDKIRFEYVSKLVSTNDYHRRIHNYRYQFLEDVADPNRLVFYQMAADYYLGPDFDTYYVGDSTGLLQESTSEPGGNVYKAGKFSFLDRWLASDDLVALDKNTAKATRGIIQRSSTLNGNDFPVFMHKYGRSWGSDKMMFDLAGESVKQSYSAGDVVEGEVEFILPAKQKENYWGADTEFATRLDTYTKPWESVFDEYRYNNKIPVTVHKGTLLNNFPIEIIADQDGPSVIADVSIQSGGLGHVPIVIKEAVIGKSLNVERYINGDWVPLEVNATSINSYYQGYQNAKGTIDYAFSIKRPASDLAAAWRIRVSYDEPLVIPENSSHFRMIGNKLFDPQGNLFIPKGVNIFPWHSETDTIAQIASCWNFNTVRLHSWILPDKSTDQWKDHLVYLDEPLIFDPDNLDGLRTYDIRDLIESYTSRGIVVLFDVHDLLGKYFEGQHLKDYKTFITDFARKFKDNPYVWIDLHNEPGTYQGAGNVDQAIPANDFSRWQAEYAAMREAVRVVAPNMPIFASGDAWGQDTGPSWNGNQLVVTEESALLSNANFFKSDPQLAATLHVYDQWNYGNDRTGRLADYFDRVQSATQSPLLIGEFGYKDNTGNATEALYTLLQQSKYQHMGRIAWTWSANDDNDLTTDTASHGSGAAIDTCNTQPTNLTRLGELVWQDTHVAELDSDNDNIPNQQDEDDDNDGMPDLWEVEHGLDSTDATDATTDRNDDGHSNLQEYFASKTIAQLQNSALGSIPVTPLLSSRPVTALGIQYDELTASTSGSNYDPQTCDVSAFWPADRVEVGGNTSGNDETVCKVQAQTDDGALKFVTKWPLNNIHAPLTPEAAWAKFRFPIPQNHTAKTIEYDLSWYKLFGSKPTHCHPSEIDANTGECLLDVSENWQSDVPAGIYFSWAKPGDRDSLITGPHGPIEKIGYSGKNTFQVDVPKQYQDIDELIVSLVVYNQYTKACEKDKPDNCTTHENENLELQAVRLKTSRVLNPEKQPAIQHPRILGHGSEWTDYWQPFEDLSCVESNSDSDWGSVFNTKNIWDKTTKGYAACKDTKPAALQDVSDASFYLTPSANNQWSRDRALRVLFLLRQLKQCHANEEGESCLYSTTETQQLQAAFIAYEMNRFTSIDWDWGYNCFDLGTEPPMKFWSIFVDVFWDDLSATHKTAIDNKLAEKADCYLAQYAEKHWSIFNGNNWTPVLGKGAMYWAIAYYHEDPRAPKILEKVLESLWLHRDFYLEDGAYIEGVIEYTNVSYSSLREINNLLMQGFGIPLESVAWERTEKTADWYLDAMAPDGAMVDFGDSWDKLGWYTLDPLHMLLWEEMIGTKPVGTVTPDVCKVQEYFSNKWFQKGLDDPWSIQPSMARDWINLAASCDVAQQAGTQVGIFEEAVTGSIRQHLPGSNPFAQQDALKFKQADQTYLAVSGIPNDFPHRELDFGALVWSAYGNRLLYDFGYGEIAKTAQGRPYLINDGDTQLYDNLALGANTLVVEDATQSGYSGGKYNDDTINSSQIYGERGTLEAVTFGGYKGLRLDAKAVYGANDAELGWLRYFDRWMLSLDDGNFLVIDAFAVKDDRPAANVQEYWHTAATAELAENCSFTHQNIVMTLENPSSIILAPECARLHREAASDVMAKITAVSLQPGKFSIDPDIIEYPNRIGRTTSRRRARFAPDTNVREDVRVFLLQAAPNSEQLTDITLHKVECGAALCFDLNQSGGTQRIEFTQSNNQYALSQILALPDAFSFISQGNVEPNTTVTSAAINVMGIETAVTISVANGEYSINGAAFTSAIGTVNGGQSVRAQHTAAAGFNMQTDTVLNIGGISATFSSTTKADDPADITAPVITAPTNLTQAAKGYKTRFTVTDLQQQGDATDETDGALGIVLESVNDIAPVFRAGQTVILLRPGRHNLTWAATDNAGNKGTATQQVNVLPKASFLVNQSASEGENVSLDVILNGDAPAYPVSIPFTISGSADTQDYQLTPSAQEVTINQPVGNEKPTGSVDIALLEDNVAEGDEQIIFAMGENPDNAVQGRKTRHKVKIVAQNMPPQARIRVSQKGMKGNRVYQHNGPVLVNAKARDPNKGDSLTYEWLSQTLIDSALDTDPTTFEANPQAHPIGWHTLTLQVSDGVHRVEKRKRIRIKLGGIIAFAATQDTDGDGTLDNDEPGDDKGNGIPDYLESSELDSSQLSIGQDNPMETEPGLSFEIGAAAQWQDHNSSKISEAQLKAYQEAEHDSYQPDTYHTPRLILDYRVHGLEENGSTVSMLINLSDPLPSNAVIRKYNPTSGWQGFLTDTNNRIETAVSPDGNCPTDGSIDYQDGIQTGATCLRISIQDGGPNDADGLANGTIVDLLAIATIPDGTIVDPLTIATTPNSTDSSNNSDGGGGGFALQVLMLLFTIRAFRQWRKARINPTATIRRN